MSEYIANPDRDETPEAIATLPTRRLKGGSHGLDPEAAIPRPHGPDPAPCRLACVFCGHAVLHGQTATGEHLVLALVGADGQWLSAHIH